MYDWLLLIPEQFSSDPGLGPGEVEPAWVNAMLGRIFWDFLRERYWADLVAHKIQKKLTKIRVRDSNSHHKTHI